MKKTALIIALVMLITCFGGCAFKLPINTSAPKTNKISVITSYVQSKYPKDDIKFISQSQYDNYDSLFPVKNGTTTFYKFYSDKYRQEFYCIYKSGKETDKIYDNYCDLMYFDDVDQELETILSQIGSCNYYFTTACITKIGDAYNYYNENVHLSDEWYQETSISVAVVLKERPDNPKDLKEKITNILDDSFLSRLGAFDVAFYFGDASSSDELVPFVFNDEIKQTPRCCSSWDFTDTSPYFFNFNNIEPYSISYRKYYSGETELYGYEYIKQENNNNESEGYEQDGYFINQWG